MPIKIEILFEQQRRKDKHGNYPSLMKLISYVVPGKTLTQSEMDAADKICDLIKNNAGILQSDNLPVTIIEKDS